MPTILEEATLAIKAWNDVRNDSLTTIKKFDEGVYFSFSRSDFDCWKSRYEASPTPEKFYLHGYLGLVSTSTNTALCLYGVDSDTDKKTVNGNETAYSESLQQLTYHTARVAVPHFNEQLGDQLNPLEALQRSTQWLLHKNIWLEQQTNMAQVLAIPFKDLKQLFDRGSDSVIVQMALKYTGNNKYRLDLILWEQVDNKGIIAKYPEDLIHPVPPFSVFPETSFQLLHHALPTVEA